MHQDSSFIPRERVDEDTNDEIAILRILGNGMSGEHDVPAKTRDAFRHANTCIKQHVCLQPFLLTRILTNEVDEKSGQEFRARVQDTH